jgi:hypothetical protein
MTHTKEPWRANHANAGNCGYEVAGGDKFLNQVCDDVREDNARRIAACVNALEGGWNFKEISAYTKSLEDKTKWNLISEKMPPVNVWCEFYAGDKTMRETLLNHIDKIDKHGDMAVNYLHNYTHWRELSAPA